MIDRADTLDGIRKKIYEYLEIKTILAGTRFTFSYSKQTAPPDGEQQDIQIDGLIENMTIINGKKTAWGEIYFKTEDYKHARRCCYLKVMLTGETEIVFDKEKIGQSEFDGILKIIDTQ